MQPLEVNLRDNAKASGISEEENRRLAREGQYLRLVNGSYVSMTPNAPASLPALLDTASFVIVITSTVGPATGVQLP